MLRLQDYSIAEKLTWLNIVVTGFALLLAGAAFFGLDLLTFRATLVQRCSTQAQIIGANSASALLFNDPRSAGVTLAALRAAPNIVSAAIYTPDGRSFAGYWRDHPGESRPLTEIPAGQTEVHWFKDGQLALIRRLVFQGQLTGFVAINTDLNEIRHRFRQYGVVSTLVLLTSVAIALLASSGLRRAIAEPVMIGQKAQEEIRKLNRELERRVADRTAELAASNKELEAFAYSVSHDLRAPLRHMDGFLALLVKRSNGQLDEAGRRYLEKVMAASCNMGILIDDLLRFSRLGRNAMAKTRVNLQTAVREIRQEFEVDTAGRAITWQIRRLPEVVADHAMLRLVLVNLLSNALKFTRTRPEARIEVGSVPANENEDVIFVKDNGVGFDPQYGEKLFNVFQRLHPSSEFEGTGVGLANVRRIVERHGGRVWAESAEGSGATFYFSLPRLQNWESVSHERSETYSAGGGQ